MLRILALEIGFDRAIAVGPEAGEVPRDLDRPAGGREQMQQHLNAAAGDARRLGGAEHLLQPHRQDRHRLTGDR